MTENRWIVINEDKGNKIKLVSKSNVEGILPKRFILNHRRRRL